MSLSPIGIPVYSRLEHLKKTVEALRRNALANQSTVYFFSDGPKQGDQDKVQVVRDYLRTVDGFADIRIVERDENSRLKNCRGGMRELVDTFGKTIWMEEDIVTASGFLTYMNGALDFYQHDPKVLTITGYSPPIIIPDDYPHDVFALRRMCAWGMGIWKDRYLAINYIDRQEIERFFTNSKYIKELSRYGDDLLNMIRRDANGDIDALDVKAMYHQFVNEMYTVYPRKSLTFNIGHDGTGVHCGNTNIFDVDLWDRQMFNFVKDIKIDERIVLSNYNFRQKLSGA